MSSTGLAAFDSTINTTNIWLHDIMDRMGWGDRHRAYHALRVVLHALRDHLSVDGVAALGAQLPMLIRGLYYEGWNPSGKPIKWHKPEFLACIRDGFRGREEADPEAVARAVFTVLARHVSEGEIEDVKHILPKKLRELWPEVRPLRVSKGEQKSRKPL